MFFRLSNGEILSLADELTDLSEFLQSIKQDTQPVWLLSEALKNSPHKPVKGKFLQAWEEVVQSPEVSGLFIQALSTASTTLAPSTTTFMSEETIAAAESSQGGSMDTSTLKAALAAHFQVSATGDEADALMVALEFVEPRLKTIFEPMIHHLSFLSDEALRFTLDFLALPCSKRSVAMFDNLPSMIQGCPPDQDWKKILENCYHVYVDFINDLSCAQLMELTKAACHLNIIPMQVLVGCRLAKLCMLLSEDEVRKKFGIPNKYRSAVREKLRKERWEQPWVAAAEQRLAQMAEETHTEASVVPMESDEYPNIVKEDEMKDAGSVL
jgi:hypothetical protein